MEDYKVNIKTTADTSGAVNTSKALQDLGKSAKDAVAATQEHGEHAKHTGNLIEELGSRSGHTRHLVEGLEQAAHGGTRGILGLARAIFSASSAINPLTLVLGGLLALTPTLIEWGEKLFGAGEKGAEGIGEAGAAAKEAARELEEMHRAGEHAGDLQFEHLKEQIKEVDDAAKNAAEKLDAMLGAEDRVDRAREKLELLHNANNPMLSEEQKARNEVSIKDRYAERGLQRERTKITAGVQAAFTAASQRGDERQAEEQQEHFQSGIVESLKGRVAARAALEKQIERQKDAVTAASIGNAEGTNGAQVAAESTKLMALEKRLEQIASAELLNRMLAEAEGRLSKIAESVEKTRHAEADAKRHANQVLEIANIKEPAAVEVSGLEKDSRFAEALPKIDAGNEKDWKDHLNTRAGSIRRRVSGITTAGKSEAEQTVIAQAQAAAEKLEGRQNDENISALVDALRRLTAAAMAHGAGTSGNEFKKLTSEVDAMRREQEQLRAQIRNASRNN